jgi:CheY-like chemotaxis protein
MCSILVVEDNAVFCGSLRDMLSHSLTSLSIDTALDGNEGF